MVEPSALVWDVRLDAWQLDSEVYLFGGCRRALSNIRRDISVTKSKMIIQY